MAKNTGRLFSGEDTVQPLIGGDHVLETFLAKIMDSRGSWRVSKGVVEF